MPSPGGQVNGKIKLFSCWKIAFNLLDQFLDLFFFLIGDLHAVFGEQCEDFRVAAPHPDDPQAADDLRQRWSCDPLIAMFDRFERMDFAHPGSHIVVPQIGMTRFLATGGTRC